MVAHILTKRTRNLINDVFWIENTLPPAEDALYYDSLHINEWSIGPPSKKHNWIKISMAIKSYFYLPLFFSHE